METTIINKLETFCTLSTPEIYWDYNSELSTEQITKIINGDLIEVSDEIYELNIEHIWGLENETINEAIDKYIDEVRIDLDIPDDKITYDELPDDVLDSLRENISVSTNMDDLIGNTTVNLRLVLYSNYDCMNSHWFESVAGPGYQLRDNYFGDVVKLLKLNPYRLKEAFDKREIKTYGHYPHLPSRDGKELVDYDEFVEDLENVSCGAVNLTFLAKVKIKSYLEVPHPKKVELPAGTLCGLWSDFLGGGGLLETKLLKDTVIKIGNIGKTEYDNLSMFPDDSNGYGYKDSAGTDDSIFETLKLIK